MFKAITRFFDKLEDKVRVSLSHRSVIYAFIGGTAHVIFWRGIWHTSDFIMSGNWHLDETRDFWGWLFYEPITLIWTSAILLLTGLFVATFIGERVIMSGLKHEKKVTDRTEEEVKKEEDKIVVINNKINAITNDLAEIKDALSKK
ncbi:MAG: hypothetical protein WC027_00085 [Candidatus Paceibacterota bacterium]